MAKKKGCLSSIIIIIFVVVIVGKMQINYHFGRFSGLSPQGDSKLFKVSIPSVDVKIDNLSLSKKIMDRVVNDSLNNIYCSSQVISQVFVAITSTQDFVSDDHSLWLDKDSNLAISWRLINNKPTEESKNSLKIFVIMGVKDIDLVSPEELAESIKTVVETVIDAQIELSKHKSSHLCKNPDQHDSDFLLFPFLNILS